VVPCLVLGDSIAIGTATALPRCHTETVVGITSSAWVHRFGGHSSEAGFVVISLGANDGAATHTKQTIKSLRSTVRACRVVWLLPAYPAQAREAIRIVAAAYGDRMVDTAPYAPPGGLHPSGRGYAAVAHEAENAMQGTIRARIDRLGAQRTHTVSMQIARINSCGMASTYGMASSLNHTPGNHRTRGAATRL
jgi:hypothetical protein